MTDLTERDAAILDFESSWWMHPGAKDARIRERFDLTAVRYYQLLNALLDHPAALAHDPMTVRRLRRVRARRLQQRQARRLDFSV